MKLLDVNYTSAAIYSTDYDPAIKILNDSTNSNYNQDYNKENIE